jgi:hypothetical protein
MWSWDVGKTRFCSASACQLHIRGDFTFTFYKHGISRRYLLLDDSGKAYEARGPRGFAEIPFAEALARVEQPLKELGASLETSYDNEYVVRKAQVLRAAGIEMVRIVIDYDEGEV